MARAYYNEIDPFAAQWLRNLIDAGHIAAGDVDERSIADVQPGDLAGYTQCHFFAGLGGWSLALKLAGWPDDRSVWTGSCPCQPFSASGKRKGGADERHLWPHWFRLIQECYPAIVFGEQVARAIGKTWLDAVAYDMEGQGYALGSAVLPACAVSAPHRRDRLWFVADASGTELRDEPGRRDGSDGAGEAIARDDGASQSVADADLERRREQQWQRSGGAGSPFWQGAAGERPHAAVAGGGWWDAEPNVGRVAHGVSGRVAICRPSGQGEAALQDEHWFNRVGALHALGNAIVPQVAAEFIGAYLDATA